jgi:hypothetical protein
MSLQEAIQDYYDVRTANATDLTVEQVKTLNSLERQYSDHGEFTVDVTRNYKCQVVSVIAEFTADQWARDYANLDHYYFYVVVDKDGSTRSTI